MIQNKAPVCLSKTLRCLALLLSGLATVTILAGTRQDIGLCAVRAWRAQEPSGYLPTIGAPGLRFREPEPAPASAPRLVGVGPPNPSLSPVETAVAVANTAALRVPMAGDLKAVDPSPSRNGSTPEVSAKPVPPAILPDDTRPQVHAEDFLPFFQLPGTSPTGNSTVVPESRGASVPAPLPPSSATYTQTPK